MGWLTEVALGPMWSWGGCWAWPWVPWVGATMGWSLGATTSLLSMGQERVRGVQGHQPGGTRPFTPGCPTRSRGWVLRSGHPWVPGVNCEVNPDDCASDPCVHGVCQDGIDRYDCVCQPGFTGGCPWVLGGHGAHWVLLWVLGVLGTQWVLPWVLGGLGAQWVLPWVLGGHDAQWVLLWVLGVLGAQWVLPWLLGGHGAQWVLPWVLGVLGAHWVLPWVLGGHGAC